METVTTINQNFVTIFKLLKSKSTNEECWDPLLKYFGGVTWTEKSFLQVSQEHVNCKGDWAKMQYFKDTDFSDIELSPEETELLSKCFQAIYDECQKQLLTLHIAPPKPTFDIDAMMNDSNIKSLMHMSNMSKKQLRKFLLANQDKLEQLATGPKDVDDLSALFGNLFQDSTMYDQIKNFIDQSPLGSILESLGSFGVENGDEKQLDFNLIIDNIRKRIHEEYPDIESQFKKLLDMFDSNSLDDLFDKASSFFTNDPIEDSTELMRQIKEFIDNDPSVQQVLARLYTVFQSGVVNLKLLKENCRQVLHIGLDECLQQKLITQADYDTLVSLLTASSMASALGIFGNKKKKLNKEQRRDRRTKNYRRKRRQQLKRLHGKRQ